MRADLKDTDSYLSEWRRGEPADCGDELEAEADAAARRLEENNIVVNYQASPDEEGFTASGSLRMGVSEMTRFGMGPEDFGELAELIRDVITDRAVVKPRVSEFRKRFLDMKYCFMEDELADRLQQLHRLV